MKALARQHSDCDTFTRYSIQIVSENQNSCCRSPSMNCYRRGKRKCARMWRSHRSCLERADEEGSSQSESKTPFQHHDAETYPYKRPFHRDIPCHCHSFIARINFQHIHIPTMNFLALFQLLVLTQIEHNQHHTHMANIFHTAHLAHS